MLETPVKNLPKNPPGENINKYFRLKIDNQEHVFKLIRAYPKRMIPFSILHHLGVDIVTNESPLGFALTNASAGDELTYESPAGPVQIEILQIF